MLRKRKDKKEVKKEKLKEDEKKIKNNFLKNIKKFWKKINIFTKEDKVTYSFKEVVIVMFFSLGLGVFSCFSFMRIFNGGKNYITLSKDLDKFVDAYVAVVDNYYDDLDKDVLVDSAINGMMESVGDSYTNYTNTALTDNFNDTVGGVYKGIGCSVFLNENNQIEVYSLFDKGSAKESGIEVGDIITAIDDKSYEGKTTNDMAEYVKNTKNKEITLTILRGEEEKEIKVTKKKVEIPVVNNEVKEINNKKIGYLSISLFSSVSDTQFKSNLKKLEKQNIAGLVIDVRNNGGGYLSSVTNISNLLLEKDKVIYQLKTKAKTIKKKDKTKDCRTYPIAILINESSASASEILASAIKESYNGFVVGTNSYGKGSVQQTTSLADGSMVKYTIENWLTPKGNNINKKGVEPTNYVELNEAYTENPISENDNQLQEAFRLVSE